MVDKLSTPSVAPTPIKSIGTMQARYPKVRFSLKLALAGLTLVASALGFWCSAAKQQQNAVRELQQSPHVFVTYAFDRNSGFLKGPDASPLPKWMIDAVGLDMFHRVKMVSAINVNFGDENLAPIFDLNGLQFLFLLHSAISDDGLAPIHQLQNLEGLNIENTRISDKAIPHLLHLKNLRWINIAGTDISEAGIRQLEAALPHCKIQRTSHLTAK